MYIYDQNRLWRCVWLGGLGECTQSLLHFFSKYCVLGTILGQWVQQWTSINNPCPQGVYVTFEGNGRNHKSIYRMLDDGKYPGHYEPVLLGASGGLWAEEGSEWSHSECQEHSGGRAEGSWRLWAGWRLLQCSRGERMISQSKKVAVDAISKSYSDKSRIERIGFSIG